MMKNQVYRWCNVQIHKNILVPRIFENSSQAGLLQKGDYLPIQTSEVWPPAAFYAGNVIRCIETDDL